MHVYEFSVDYGSIDVDDILDIHKYLMLKNNNKIMCWLIKQVFIALVSFSGSLALKSVSYNEPCMARPTLIKSC